MAAAARPAPSRRSASSSSVSIIQRFDEVDEAFAVAEGEGPYDAWRSGHIDYFDRNGGYAPDMLLVCERFRVVEVFKREAD